MGVSEAGAAFAPRLADGFPALSAVLGDEAFAELAGAAVTAAAEAGRRPGEMMQAVVTRRIVRGQVTDPLPDPVTGPVADPGTNPADSKTAGATGSWNVPSRLVADLAALEWAMVAVDGVPVGTELPLRRDEFPSDDGTVLVPVAGFRIVSVAFRLDAYVRRIHQGRRPEPPARADQSIVIYRPYGSACRLVLDRGEGRLLSLLAVGTPVGEAVEAAVQHEWMPDAPTARDTILNWVGEGMFAGVRRAVEE